MAATGFQNFHDIWKFGISTDDDMSDSVTYKETTNGSIIFKYSFSSGNVGQLLYSKNVLETPEFFSHAFKKITFPMWKKLKV